MSSTGFCFTSGRHPRERSATSSSRTFRKRTTESRTVRPTPKTVGRNCRPKVVAPNLLHLRPSESSFPAAADSWPASARRKTVETSCRRTSAARRSIEATSASNFREATLPSLLRRSEKKGFVKIKLNKRKKAKKQKSSSTNHGLDGYWSNQLLAKQSSFWSGRYNFFQICEILKAKK